MRRGWGGKKKSLVGGTFLLVFNELWPPARYIWVLVECRQNTNGTLGAGLKLTCEILPFQKWHLGAVLVSGVEERGWDEDYKGEVWRFL